MVSGSSDCTVCVWDLWAEYPTHERRRAGHGKKEGDEEGHVNAQVRAVLEGHTGGVLDVRIDERWIVSWSVWVLSCS